MSRNYPRILWFEPLSSKKENEMRALNLITLLLIIVGGVNWLLVGIANFDLVAAIFGGQQAMLSRVVYVLVGLSALWQLMPFAKAISIGETAAQANLAHRR
jgi:uncharacterized membrane protein YuzA (DUF378 family)